MRRLLQADCRRKGSVSRTSAFANSGLQSDVTKEQNDILYVGWRLFTEHGLLANYRPQGTAQAATV